MGSFFRLRGWKIDRVRKCVTQTIAMTKEHIVRFSVVLFLNLTAAAAIGQQTLVQTVTSLNRSCNQTCTVIDVPALNNNHAAVIYVTEILVNSTSLNRHPIGAYYMYQNKWSVYNVDGVMMDLGVKFRVDYVSSPDAKDFVFVVPSQPQPNGRSYIDNSALNNNPGASFRIFPISNTGALFDTYSTTVDYDPGVAKWGIANLNGQPVAAGAAFSVMIDAGGNSGLTVAPVMNTATFVPMPTPIPVPTPAGSYIQNTTTQQPTSNFNISGSGTAAELSADTVGIGTTTPRDKLEVNGNIRVNSLGASGMTPLCLNAVNQIANCIPPAPAPSPTQGMSSPSGPKAAALYFKQSIGVNFIGSNSTAVIPGLDNQVFTLPQNSHVVFHTALDTRFYSNALISVTNAVSVWSIVEILNVSNSVVATSTFHTWIAADEMQNLNSVGFVALPAGTYHTRVSINRQENGAQVLVPMQSSGHQGGLMIIEIFPD
jgi:hypothetical protein